MSDTRWWPLEPGRQDDSAREFRVLDFCVMSETEHNATFPCDVLCRM